MQQRQSQTLSGDYKYHKFRSDRHCEEFVRDQAESESKEKHICQGVD